MYHRGMVRPVVAASIACVLVLSCAADETEKSRFNDGGSSAEGTGPTTGVGGTAVTTGAGAMGGMPATTSSTGSSPVTTSSSSSGQVCNDPGPEPNDTIQQATYLGAIDDCDGSGSSFSGVLDGNDVDWFYYQGSDAFGCAVGPVRTINADAQVRICKYIECLSGTPEFTCPANAALDNAGGLPGCCAQDGLDFGINCTGTSDDSANVYLRIDKPSGFSCVSYSVSFHY